jgi:hypothetical protein
MGRMFLPNFKATQHIRFIQIRQGSQIVLPNQYLRIPQWWQIFFTFDFHLQNITRFGGNLNDWFAVLVVLRHYGPFPHSFRVGYPYFRILKFAKKKIKKTLYGRFFCRIVYPSKIQVIDQSKIKRFLLTH